jgi:hypothetical protein
VGDEELRWRLAALDPMAGRPVTLTSGGSDAPKPAANKTVLALSGGSGGPSMGMCVALSPEILRNAAHAFEGTVTSTFQTGKTYLAAAETEIAPCSGTDEETPAGKAMFEQAFGS